jgi:competence protein ComEA
VNKWQILVSGILIGFLFSALIILFADQQKGKPILLQAESTPGTIQFEVLGAVRNPGIYSSESIIRVIDAVNLAGGLTENADAQNSNLTEKIYDTDRIIIPTISLVQATTTSIATINNQKRINLNTASLDELMLLPGIGEKKAKDIIEYRTNIQPFSSVSDLLNISGFGEKTIEEFYDQVTVESGG